MIRVSTNGRGHMKVFVFTGPKGWNSITVCSISPTFCSVTLLDKLRIAEFWGEEPRTNVLKIFLGTTHPRIIHLPQFIQEGFISEPFPPGLFINRLLIPGLFISELFISDNSSLNTSSPDYSSLNNSSLDHSSPNNSTLNNSSPEFLTLKNSSPNNSCQGYSSPKTHPRISCSQLFK